jgi:hypothetical protein
MDTELLKALGEALGIGGLALGVFFLLFREVIRKSIFPTLRKPDAYRLLRLVSVLVWLVAIGGIAAWVWGARTATTSSIVTTGPQSPIVKDTRGNVRMEFNGSPAGSK